jgi:mono/diheme cytochrome c family protein
VKTRFGRRDACFAPASSFTDPARSSSVNRSSNMRLKMQMKATINRLDGGAFRMIAAALLILALLVPGLACAQTVQSAEEARLLEFGKEIFKSKAVCQFCHKWDASGDQGYGGNALSLRATQLSPEQLTEVVKCGRPGTGMPYHDRFAYTDKRCYGYTSEQLGNDTPPAGNDFLSNREVEAVVKYLFAKDVGRGPATYEDCVDFWGKDTQQCEPMKK